MLTSICQMEPLIFGSTVFGQAQPTLDGAFALQVFLRVVHILGAVILAGGLFYQRSILSPEGVDACFAGRRQVWAKWVGIATLMLLASGLYNFITILRTAKFDGTPLPPTYHALFGVKFLLGLLVMFLAAILAGKTAAAERFRQKMGKWLNVAWTASLTILVLAAILRNYH
ncbi:hypothetical protein [Bythopirellula polymerisocia]|uniref:Copper resistance protein D n=1 Tax=Bythopirellula polymerisocia TaxID=2528003 RepID=A0A5C6CN54_9BACT|nr:hypothetical protein [Bythopirellula polymerisocia]TWU25832.1 hypothetical protein Pla144_30440 [Bythopirellula polymerisocia]